MESVQTMGLLAGGSAASGINLYLTVAGLGIAHRMQWVTLPGELDAFAHPVIIGIAIVMFAIEFFADKVPYVDSSWDAIHTFIRPLGGMALGYLAMSDAGPALQYPIAALTGAVATQTHLTKATARAAINTSPEPVSNSVASVTEDAGVFGTLYLIATHPVVIIVLVVVFLAASLWFLFKMGQLIKRIFTRRKPKKPLTAE